VPIYIKEGAIIPTVELEQYVGELNKNNQPNPITFNIYPGNSYQNGYNAFLDDGVSRSSASTTAHPIEEGGDDNAKNQYRQTNISHVHTKDIRTVVIDRKHDNYTPF
jgi:alpha-glucosidase